MPSFFKVNEQPFFVLGGQTHNSSGYAPELLERAFQALGHMHANTLEVPVYWEQIEPQEGVFSFDHLCQVIELARQKQMHLLLLWFGTWKNGAMTYAPGWVKANPGRFPRVTNRQGEDVWVLSSHAQANWQADCSALCALLAFLKRVDEQQQTVIGIQVENEPGILGAARDYSPAAEAEFQAPVPPAAARAAGKTTGGENWPAVFGPQAAMYFSAWSVATYIDRLAQAGKQVYALPMVVNVWLEDGGWHVPGESYPSGGAVSSVVGFWKAAAPQIDLISPDIYIDHPVAYRQVCDAYAVPGNPLFVPESGQSLANAINLFYAAARGCVGYAVFGIEDLVEAGGALRPAARPVVESFQCLAAASPLLLNPPPGTRVFSVGQYEFHGDQWLDLGGYLGQVRYDLTQFWTDHATRPLHAEQRGRGLIFQTGPHEFYLTGGGFRLILKKNPNASAPAIGDDFFAARLAHYLSVEEGGLSPAGEWTAVARRNGDESDFGIWVHPSCGLVRVILTD